MSKYTTEVRFICENYAGLLESVGYSDIDDVLNKSRDKVFDFDFPIFDANYKPVLEDKILKHYYTREIGAESVGLWKHWLRTRLIEIMPYYNKLYESELIKFNPLHDTDLTTDHNKKGKGTKTGNFNETGGNSKTTEVNGTTHEDNALKNDHWDYYSDTPQGTAEDLADLRYLTNVRHIVDDGKGSTSDTTVGSTTEENGTVNRNGTNNGTSTSVEDYLQHIVGKSSGVSYSKLLEEYRQTFLNIDMMVIEDLSDLFMNIW